MMKDKVIEWLLEENNPSVRYFAFKDLLGMPLDDPVVRMAREDIMIHGTAAELFKLQNDDGSWWDPDKFYRSKYKGAVWTLLILAEMAADPDDIRVKKACEFILDHVQEPEGGGFSYDKSARTGKGLPGSVVPCLTGNMVYALIKLGFLDDERVQKAIQWIITYQRADDKTGEPPAGEFYERYDMGCWGRHSCHMGVAKTFKALAAVPPEKRSRETNYKIDEFAEYFLLHHIYKKSHDLTKTARPGWLKPGFPLMYQTDILELLGIFADLGIKDPRLDDALSILKNKKTEDGKWVLENSFNGKMLVDIEEKGKPSKWITLKALKVLKIYNA